MYKLAIFLLLIFTNLTAMQQHNNVQKELLEVFEQDQEARKNIMHLEPLAEYIKFSKKAYEQFTS